MRLIYIFALLITGFISLDTKAAGLTALELRDKCLLNDEKKFPLNLEAYGNEMFCLGVVAGAMDSYSLLKLELPAKYCQLPEKWTVGQGVEVFLKWIKNNPEFLDKAAVGAVFYSQMQAFCGWKKN